MEKKRLAIGKEYWYAVIEDCKAVNSIEKGSDIDNALFNIGNYFTTKEEAELVARRLNMVLQEGAKAIIIPTNEEVKQAAYCNDSGYEDSQIAGFKDGIEWLENLTL